METVYCQLVAKGEVLPPINEFRKSGRRVQSLLLTRGAKRHGLALPSGYEGTYPAASSVPSRTNHYGSQHGAAEASSCRLQARFMLCDGRSFELVDDLAVGSIDRSNLEAGNQLVFPPRLPAQEPLDYLILCYRTYVDKMLSIGLGGSIMSLTKFHYIWEQLGENDGLFAERFRVMFDFLKRDKWSNAPRIRESSDRPKSVSQCSRLSSHMWICDDVSSSWIYANSSLDQSP